MFSTTFGRALNAWRSVMVLLYDSPRSATTPMAKGKLLLSLKVVKLKGADQSP